MQTKNIKITNETKVGILTVVTLLILIIGYNFLKGNDLFSNENNLYAKYNRVNGLSVSKPVLINGFPVGRVSKLTLLPNGQILTELKVQRDYLIPKNTVARLESTDLLGGKAIVFMMGNSNQFAKDGDTLSTYVQKNIIEQVEPVQQQAVQIIAHLDSVLTSVHNTLSPQFQHNFERSFASIARNLETLEKTTKKIDALVGTQSVKIDGILGDLHAVTTNFKNNNQNVTSIITNLNKVSDQAAKANIGESLTQANKAINDLQSIITKINSGQGTLGQLVNDKNLYTNLSRAADNLDKLMIDLKSNPKRYVHFSVFGKKNQEPK